MRFFFVASIVLAVLFAPLAFRAIFDGGTSLLHIDSIHDYTGEPKESIILTQVLRLVVFPFPFFCS